MKGDRERLLADGFDGYLEKPIDIREFPDQIRRYCRFEDALRLVAPAKLLVVDDTPRNVRLLEAVLTSNGYAVTSANSGPRGAGETLERPA